MDSYLKNLIEAAVKKGTEKTKKKKKQDVEEVVDYDGSVLGSKIPPDVDVKTITAKKTTDDTVSMARQPNNTGSRINGMVTTRNWGENDMSTTLGFDETMGRDKSYDEAKNYFMNDLGFDEIETEERLKALGYVKKSDEKVRLIEDTYLESIVNQAIENQKQLNPIVLRQLMSLKQTMQANNVTVEDIIPYLNGK
jgi:hypothetical protein